MITRPGSFRSRDLDFDFLLSRDLERLLRSFDLDLLDLLRDRDLDLFRSRDFDLFLSRLLDFDLFLTSPDPFSALPFSGASVLMAASSPLRPSSGSLFSDFLSSLFLSLDLERDLLLLLDLRRFLLPGLLLRLLLALPLTPRTLMRGSTAELTRF